MKSEMKTEHKVTAVKVHSEQEKKRKDAEILKGWLADPQKQWQNSLNSAAD